MKKLPILLLTIVIALSSISGCIDKESEQSKSNSTQEVSTEESITESTELSTESEEVSIQDSEISDEAENSAASDEKSKTPTEKSEVISSASDSSNQKSQTPTEKSEVSEVSPSKSDGSTQTSKTPTEYIYPESITLNAHNITLTSGDTYQLTATISPSNASTKSTEWHWTNNSVLELSSAGVVTAKKPGTCTITVKTTNNKTDTCTVTVKTKPQPQQSTQQQSSSQSSKQESQSSKPKPESSVQETSYNNTGIYAAYAPPYDWDTVIADLRKVGEEQYGITWEDSLYVRNHGSECGSKYGGCGFNAPTSTQDVAQGDGKALRKDCIDQFELLKKQHPDSYQNALFKIAVEDIGDEPYLYHSDGRVEYEHVYWIYLLYT